MAADYASARPPYPAVIFEVLTAEGVIGPGFRVLEVGAGAGLATKEPVASGSQVVALEPGHDLGFLLAEAVPDVQIVFSHLEDAGDRPAGDGLGADGGSPDPGEQRAGSASPGGQPGLEGGDGVGLAVSSVGDGDGLAAALGSVLAVRTRTRSPAG
jgi:hypothetical protein